MTKVQRDRIRTPNVEVHSNLLSDNGMTDELIPCIMIYVCLASRLHSNHAIGN